MRRTPFSSISIFSGYVVAVVVGEDVDEDVCVLVRLEVEDVVGLEVTEEVMVVVELVV